MTIETEGGTTFTVDDDGQVTITRHDQPVCVIPLDDLNEFIGEYFADERPDRPGDEE